MFKVLIEVVNGILLFVTYQRFEPRYVLQIIRVRSICVVIAIRINKVRQRVIRANQFKLDLIVHTHY